MLGNDQIELTFLGSGNAFGPEGRAFSSFLLNGRYLFDCGPTILQQLSKTKLSSNDIDAVFISHFHADHFFGLPFLLLDAKYGGRTADLHIVGPPGIEDRCEELLRIGYPGVTADRTPGFTRRYLEVSDGLEAEVAGLPFSAIAVQHVVEFECFGFRVQAGSQTLAYSGDSKLCDALKRLVSEADVVILECACDGGHGVHLTADDVEVVLRSAPGAAAILTHLDGTDHGLAGLLSTNKNLRLASDLARFSL